MPTVRRTAALRGLGVLLAVFALAASAKTVGERGLTEAAAAWLASLDDDQRDEALYAFDDGERFDIRLAPIWLEGLRRDSMSESQWKGWLGVLATTLSPEGLRQVETVISLEREVRRRDAESGWFGDAFGGLVHGEDRYFVAFFGEPAAGRDWGLRFDGHHLSLNWTVAADGRVSASPVFLGSEPRQVPEGWERAGLRGVPEEEDRARALWESLDASQREAAHLVFSEASGPGNGNRPLFLGEGRHAEPGEPTGLPRSAMTPPQAALLDAILDVYLSRLAPPLHEAQRAAIGDLDTLHFAWAGSFTPGEPLYYRVHGPTHLIEFDNTVPEADHVHTIVRDLKNDFGRDVLAAHYRDHHGRTQRIYGARRPLQ